MKYSICLVSPDPSITHTAEEVVQELGDDLRCNLIIIDGNVATAAEKVRPYIEKGVDALISRGGTAQALTKAYPHLPVIAIQIVATDIWQAVQKVPAGMKIGLISYSEVIYQYRALSKLMNVHPIQYFRLFHLGDEDRVIDRYVRDAQRRGIEVLIGSIHVRKYVEKYNNMHFVFLESGKESILRAIREAAATVLVRPHSQDDFKLTSNIVDYTFTGIAIFGKNKTLQKWNPAFALMFADNSNTNWQEKVLNLFSASRLSDVLKGKIPNGGEILQTDDRDYAVTWQPIWENRDIVRAIAFVHPVEQIQSYAQTVRKKQRGDLSARYTLNDIIGDSLVIHNVKRKAVKYAQTSSTVLITGESGTGKEMLAQSIHNLSQRRQGPFMAVNCGAFTESLLESELFGYEAGSFTGARKGGKAGVFELADGGTLFLDEIGDMPFVLQNRLLRVLQERMVRRVGGDKAIPVDVRIIAATNQNLEQAVEEKRFRLDLFYRLDVLRIHMPALRERKGDIPLLANTFLSRFNTFYRRHTSFDSQILSLFQTYPWKGNIRQMANIIERMVLLAEGDYMTLQDAAEALEIKIPQDTDVESQNMERIEMLLQEGKNYTEIAEILGISRSTLWRYRRKYHEEENEGKS